jgi:ABC-type phosphate/phosphonate transport system permease subunit
LAISVETDDWTIDWLHTLLPTLETDYSKALKDKIKTSLLAPAMVKTMLNGAIALVIGSITIAPIAIPAAQAIEAQQSSPRP